MNPHDFAQEKTQQALQILIAEAEISFSRSPGAGGQNVNKVESKVLLRWNLNQSQLPPKSLELIRKHLARYITVSGELLITSHRHRDQFRNKQDIFEKLEGLLIQAFTPEKKRTPTKPTKASKRKRLDGKKINKGKKENRRKINY